MSKTTSDILDNETPEILTEENLKDMSPEYEENRMIEPIDNYDFPDTIQVPDGYDMTAEPDNTRANIKFLTEKINEIIDCLNKEPS